MLCPARYVAMYISQPHRNFLQIYIKKIRGDRHRLEISNLNLGFEMIFSDI